ncbi:SufE family protein [Lutimonas zeaxanthinifaciens]|uniref:SufE family protein n=1 Tax=Lutimonas zeaxanthinifaciens TaxID=3060215 RepID=UPI00265D0B3A|nr:SufE family protein [Lutimonas sp. YSD2104]WKK65949.1 SufE family protein [Lutimonas sp. YSD2104]
MTIKEIQEEIIEDFDMFDDWMQRYEFIIENGKELPKIEENKKSEDNLIKGCQSKVWLHADYENGKLRFSADSDAILTKGIISLLLKVYNEQTPDDILQTDPFFIDEIGLKEHLSPTRANGLLSMVKQIKLLALAYKSKN